jgi:6-phosphogluconolactonase
MRFLLVSLSLLGCAMSLRADTYLYVSMAPEEKIQIYKLDPTTGKLSEVGNVSVKGQPGCLTVDPTKRFLFGSLRTTTSLASFRLDPSNGNLTQLSSTVLEKGANAAHIATDRSGKWLVGASYMGGRVTVHGISKEGMLTAEPLQTIKTTMTAHCAAVHPDNGWVMIPHVAPNAVYQYKLDSEHGKLTDGGKAAGGTDKAGPRHLAFHPSKKYAYVSDEAGSSITAYEFDASLGLKPIQTLSTLPAEFKEKNSTAEVKVHPSGKWVWVSNRGHESLAGFKIDPATGRVAANGHTPTEKTPRSFEVDPDGKYVFGAGEGSGKLAVFRLDDATGQLTRIHTYDVGSSLTWVLALKLP